METTKTTRLLRVRDVMNMTGIKRASIYRYMKKGLFPQGRRIGTTLTAWSEEEILEWIANRPYAFKSLPKNQDDRPTIG